jgi:hypothetical protein
VSVWSEEGLGSTFTLRIPLATPESQGGTVTTDAGTTDSGTTDAGATDAGATEAVAADASKER